ncbi:MAG: TetR/AcrR family transcriptional regulator [Marmoricola sp.]
MATRGPRPQGADTRSDILAAASSVFADKGYAGASVRGIAREAGVDPALVHHYFESKPALFFASVMPVAQGLPAVNPSALVDQSFVRASGGDWPTMGAGVLDYLGFGRA